MGASAARSLLLGEDPITSELDMGVGWQDPAVILETGLCIWKSGAQPALVEKVSPGELGLDGRMAVRWTYKRDRSSTDIGRTRPGAGDLALAGRAAAAAVRSRDFDALCAAVTLAHGDQLAEGMKPLESRGERAMKYCGAGFGGMALYLFESRERRDAFVAEDDDVGAIEPHMRHADLRTTSETMTDGHCAGQYGSHRP